MTKSVYKNTRVKPKDSSVIDQAYRIKKLKENSRKNNPEPTLKTKSGLLFFIEISIIGAVLIKKNTQ